MSALEEAFFGAGFDESKHPREAKGTPMGGRWKALSPGDRVVMAQTGQEGTVERVNVPDKGLSQGLSYVRVRWDQSGESSRVANPGMNLADAEAGLTGPQAELLARVREKGEVRRNGRARRTIEALEKAGLIEYDYELEPHANGRWTEVFLVRPRKLTAAGFDESKHPRHPEGSEVGGQFRALYHVSPVSNRQAIREKGLLAEAPKRYTDSGPGVYTFGSRDEAWRFATTGERMYGDSDIWEIRNEGLKLEPDPFFEPGHPLAERAVAQMGEKPAAFVTRGNISPEALTLHPNPWHPDPETTRRLVQGGLESWVGSPQSMRIHMAAVLDPDNATPYEDLAGSGKEMRDQAEALVQAVREGGANDKPLYRGARSVDPGDLGLPQSWSEDRAVAKKWAGKDGQVFTLKPGEARGIRMADYIGSGLNVRERQWLIDPLSRPQEVSDSPIPQRVADYLELVDLHGRTSKAHKSRIEKRINNAFRHMSVEDRARLEREQQKMRDLIAAGWDESEHPRHPRGSDRGGEFAPKNQMGGDPFDLPEEMQYKDTRRIAVKVGQAKNFREELDNWYYTGRDGVLEPWRSILDNWGNWTMTELYALRDELAKQLKEGEGSGLLSAQYAKEIGRSLSPARNEARRLYEAVDKAITIEQFGLEKTQELYPELFEAKAPKAKPIDPRSQGIPEVYLSEKGTFKPGYDAKLKSDLVNSYFDLNPQQRNVVREQADATIDTQRQVADWWKERNADEYARQGWSDAEIYRVARNDPLLPPDIYRQIPKAKTKISVESTLLHRFDPAVAKRILEERGWLGHLESKRGKLGGLLERDPLGDDIAGRERLEGIYSTMKATRSAYRSNRVPGSGGLEIRGFHLGSVQELVGSAAEIPDTIHRRLRDHGVQLFFGPPESTDLDEMWAIRDEKARNNDRRTMKQVAGFYSPAEKRVIISADLRSGSASLSAHEIGHAMGDVFGVDNHPELHLWHNRLKPKLSRYYLQNGNDRAGAQELWAEGVGLHYHLQRIQRLGRGVTYRRSGPFKDAATLDTPEGREYMDWVAHTLREIEEGRDIPQNR